VRALAAALTRAMPRRAQFPPIGCTLGPPPGRLRGGALGSLGNVTVGAPLECCARCAERFSDAQAFFVCINRGGCTEVRCAPYDVHARARKAHRDDATQNAFRFCARVRPACADAALPAQPGEPFRAYGLCECQTQKSNQRGQEPFNVSQLSCKDCYAGGIIVRDVTPFTEVVGRGSEFEEPPPPPPAAAQAKQPPPPPPPPRRASSPPPR
jgi:hypothetical protein